MFLSSVLVFEVNSLFADQRMTEQLLCISATLKYGRQIEFINLNPGLSQMSSFHGRPQKPEWQNGGMAESRNGGKWPQILKDGIVEWQNGGKSPQILKDGIVERGNDGKYPEILEDGVTENAPKS